MSVDFRSFNLVLRRGLCLLTLSLILLPGSPALALDAGSWELTRVLYAGRAGEAQTSVFFEAFRIAGSEGNVTQHLRAKHFDGKRWFPITDALDTKPAESLAMRPQAGMTFRAEPGGALRFIDSTAKEVLLKFGKESFKGTRAKAPTGPVVIFAATLFTGMESAGFASVEQYKGKGSAGLSDLGASDLILFVVDGKPALLANSIDQADRRFRLDARGAGELESGDFLTWGTDRQMHNETSRSYPRSWQVQLGDITGEASTLSTELVYADTKRGGLLQVLSTIYGKTTDNKPLWGIAYHHQD